MNGRGGAKWEGGGGLKVGRVEGDYRWTGGSGRCGQVGGGVGKVARTGVRGRIKYEGMCGRAELLGVGMGVGGGCRVSEAGEEREPREEPRSGSRGEPQQYRSTHTSPDTTFTTASSTTHHTHVCHAAAPSLTHNIPTCRHNSNNTLRPSYHPN